MTRLGDGQRLTQLTQFSTTLLKQLQNASGPQMEMACMIWNLRRQHTVRVRLYLLGAGFIVHMPCSAPGPPEAPLKQARLLRGLLQLVKPVEHGAAARPSKLRLEECDALQGGLSLR